MVIHSYIFSSQCMRIYVQDAGQKTQPVEIAIYLLLPLEERRLITLTSSFPFQGFHVSPQRTFQTLHADLEFCGLSYLRFLHCDVPTQAKCYLRAACLDVCRRLAHPRCCGLMGRRLSEHRLLSALQMLLGCCSYSPPPK